MCRASVLLRWSLYELHSKFRALGVPAIGFVCKGSDSKKISIIIGAIVATIMI